MEENNDFISLKCIEEYFVENGSRQALEKARRKPEGDLREIFTVQPPVFDLNAPNCVLEGNVLPSEKSSISYKVKVRKFKEDYDKVSLRRLTFFFFYGKFQVSLRRISSTKADISGASCSCPIGLTGLCTHVAFLLIHSLKKFTRTDLPAVWKSPDAPWFKCVEPVSSFVQPQPVPKLWGLGRALQHLKKNLGKKADDTATTMLQITRTKPHQSQPAESALAWEWSVDNLLASLRERVNNNACPSEHMVRETFRVPREIIERIVKMTASDEWGEKPWMVLRTGRFTASNILKVNLKFDSEIQIPIVRFYGV